MSLPIISADQRLAEKRGIKGCIFGKSGIGKTSLLWTLEPESTLFFDLEAGDLAIEGWTGGQRPGKSAATLRCSSACLTRHCAKTSPTARPTSKPCASASAIPWS